MAVPRTFPVAADVVGVRTGIVNVYFVGPPGAGDRGWVLVDAGLPGFAGRIADAAEDRFGVGARPAAVVLTHGHQDHVGSLKALLDRWAAPVYAHPDEVPFVTGAAEYAPPDPLVGGGVMPLLALGFSRGPFDFRPHVRPLPEGGAVPELPGWRWVATPGHTPGHVSFFRDGDRTLLAGDAFVTQDQESLIAAVTATPHLQGPPQYFTPDWPSARRSVEALAALEPEVAATGHGVPFHGVALRDALHALARDFDRVGIPGHGRYVPEGAHAGDTKRVPAWAYAAAGAVGVGLGIAARRR